MILPDKLLISTADVYSQSLRLKLLENVHFFHTLAIGHHNCFWWTITGKLRPFIRFGNLCLDIFSVSQLLFRKTKPPMPIFSVFAANSKRP